MAFESVKVDLKCFHCGDICPDESIKINEKFFCCAGCKTVYEILNENQLCSYYFIDERPGLSPKKSFGKRFDYLDDEQVIQKLLSFKDDKISAVNFYIPQMHCASCIWLLENLFKINSAILNSQVNFLKKEISIRFNHNKVSLREVVELLASLGYEPSIRLDSIDEKKETSTNKSLYIKLGVAAFAFGNIMLLSFPEYLSIDVSDIFYKKFFAYLNLILALPVFFYSASEYYISAIKGLKRKVINLDVPITLGILALFTKSSYEVLSGTGAGYFDSLAGLLFFLLIGKLFQSKTYEALNFERDYKAYFPLSVIVKEKDEERSIPVSKLKIGDRIIIRSNEIIPADAILFNGNGNIDYSFVTGESRPVQKVSGEIIYAGGRQTGGAVELEVVKEVSQSYLTQLWNSDSFKKMGELNYTQFSNTVSKYFTIIVLLIALGAGIYWLQYSIETAVRVLAAVLIIACPCALAMSTPFTLGNTLRIFGRNKFYLKNTSAVKELAHIDEIVFDKTGTITESGKSDVEFYGIELNDMQKGMVKSLARNSIHPLSKRVFDALPESEIFESADFKEMAGRGIEGKVLGYKIRLGSKEFVSAEVFNCPSKQNSLIGESRVYLSFDESYLGYFNIANSYREGIKSAISDLGNSYSLTLLSGDNEAEKENLKFLFNDESKLLFKQSPADKLHHIKGLQQKNKKVLMIGDGLNDAGALSQSDIGIAVTEDISNFSPACDAILHASELKKINKFISFSKASVFIIYTSFAISFLYNIVGLSFAVMGLLSPIVAAILMPLSSISVISFATLSTNILAKKRGLLCR